MNQTISESAELPKLQVEVAWDNSGFTAGMDAILNKCAELEAALLHLREVADKEEPGSAAQKRYESLYKLMKQPLPDISVKVNVVRKGD